MSVRVSVSQWGLFVLVLWLCERANGGISSDLTSEAFICGDEELKCPQMVADGACVGLYKTAAGREFDAHLAIATMLRCQKSCQVYWETHKDSLEGRYKVFFEVIGSASGVFKDYFGFEHDLCDPKEHHTLHSRNNLIRSSIKAWTWNMTGLTKVDEAFRPKQTKIPSHIFSFIKGFHNDIRGNYSREYCSPGLFDCQEIAYTEDEECQLKEITKALIHPLSVEDRTMIALMLEPELERLTGHDLTPALVSGMRRYLNDSFLATHIDGTGVYDMGVVVQLGQDLDEPWPLILQDQDGSRMDVYLEEGDMVLFEKTKVPHGRNKRMRGRHFDIITVNYHIEKPK